MKGLKIANDAAKKASDKEKNKGPAIVIAIGSKKEDSENCEHCGQPLPQESEEKEESEE